MGKKVTTEQFIEKAKKVHGNKYDYSKVQYINSSTKVEIICPKHGSFWQSPNNHLSKARGCPECNGGVTLTKEKFVEKAQLVHNNKYDYSQVNYINSQTKVTIICPIHGEFEQLPSNHLQGKGCPNCKGGVKSNTKEFITKAISIHGTHYNYDKVEYINALTPVIIICNKCGKEFMQTPQIHLRGSGCIHCYKNELKTTEQFVKEATELYKGKYSYEKTNYINSATKVIITCPIHGDWETTPNNHLRGHECPFCATKSKLEDEIKEFLISENIEFIPQKKFNWLGRQSLDFYIPEYNIGIECQGKQHFISENSGWNNANYLDYIQNLDNKKKALCSKNGIKLFYYSKLNIKYPYEVYENKVKMLNDIKNERTNKTNT